MDAVLPVEVCERQQHPPEHVRNTGLVQGGVVDLELDTRGGL